MKKEVLPVLFIWNPHSSEALKFEIMDSYLDWLPCDSLRSVCCVWTQTKWFISNLNVVWTVSLHHFPTCQKLEVRAIRNDFGLKFY